MRQKTKRIKYAYQLTTPDGTQFKSKSIGGRLYTVRHAAIKACPPGYVVTEHYLGSGKVIHNG